MLRNLYQVTTEGGGGLVSSRDFVYGSKVPLKTIMRHKIL